jgi:hypothetical protein
MKERKGKANDRKRKKHSYLERTYSDAFSRKLHKSKFYIGKEVKN